MPEKPPNSETDSPYALSRLSAAQRKLQLERVIEEQDERWAAEALEINQPFTPAEQEQLVMTISDPDIACEVLTLAETSGRQLTPAQAEHLMEKVESSEETAYLLYIQLVESGVIEELTDTERWWIERLEKVLMQTGDPSIAAYLLEHKVTMTAEDRERLEKIIN